MPEPGTVLWPGRDHVAVFIRCLHLLDFDLLQDWPGINEQTFNARISQQNMQTRIKGVEWTLYRLYELYSPTECRDKLRPFFPPMTSLQSVNLRAALFRVLADLKKTGVLPRDVILRKTMLDECKGDRLEELLSAFAMLVLTKALNHSNLQLSLPDHLLNMSNLQEPQSVPLILAHRFSLQKILQQRQQIELRSTARQKELDRISESLSQRRAAASKECASIDSERRGAALELLRGEWTGDSRWINTILYDGMLQSNTILATSELTPDLANSRTDTKTQGLLVDLDRRLQLQRDRLDKWRLFQQSFPSPSREDFTNTSTVTELARPQYTFDRHQSIVVGSHEFKNLHKEKKGLQGHFAALLNDITRDLSNTVPPPPEVVVPPTASAKLRQAPAVEHPHYTSSSIQPTADSFGHDELRLLRDTEDTKSSPQRLSPARSDSSTVGQADSEFSWLNETRQQLHNDDFPQSIALASPRQESLMDRTRRSMAILFTSDVETSTVSPELPLLQPKVSTEGKPKSTIIIEDKSNRRDTLFERTRRSMAATASRPYVSAAKTRSKTNRLSQLHPVNQFETPQRQTQQQSNLPPSSNGSTPREKLFSEDAEYTSIFKSRPKIAQSPALSPDRSLLEDSILARDMTILDINSDNFDSGSD